MNYSNEEELRDFIEKELLFTNEAADLLNCSRQYIYQLVKEGKLNPVKTSGRERIFLKSDIQFLKDRKKK